MKTLQVISFLLLFAAPTQADILFSDGTAASVQAKINAAADGDTVRIPAGRFTWTTGVTVSGKGIKLQGAGSGRIIARSTSSVAIGRGAKTFNLEPDPKQVAAGTFPAISAGQTLRISRLGDARTKFMEGTVTSYSNGTLQIDITAVAGTGVQDTWLISTPSATTIISNITANGSSALRLQKDASDYVEVSGIKLEKAVNAVSYMVYFGGGEGKPALLHDCWLETTISDGNNLIYTASHNGVIWNCSFSAFFNANNPGISPGGMQFEAYDDPTSWSTGDTIGDKDVGGLRNFYVEDCDWHSFIHICDTDSFSRVVLRRLWMDHAGIGSHGADTGPNGMRHAEVYDNVFVFEPNSAAVIPTQWWIWMRGGTWVVTDNVIPRMASTAWGSRTTCRMTILNLSRNQGDYQPTACWGAAFSNGAGRILGSNPIVVSIAPGSSAFVTTETPHGLRNGQEVRFTGTTATPDLNGAAYVATVNSPTAFTIPVNVTAAGTGLGKAKPVDWPAPRQVGQGHDGTGYITDAIYIWNNTGSGATLVSVEDDSTPSTCGADFDLTADYIKAGRDYFNDGTPRPGYVKFAYPHPLRSRAELVRPEPPANLRVITP